MKKPLAFILALCTIFLLCACKDNPDVNYPHNQDFSVPTHTTQTIAPETGVTVSEVIDAVRNWQMDSFGDISDIKKITTDKGTLHSFSFVNGIAECFIFENDGQINYITTMIAVSNLNTTMSGISEEDRHVYGIILCSMPLHLINYPDKDVNYLPLEMLKNATTEGDAVIGKYIDENWEYELRTTNVLMSVTGNNLDCEPLTNVPSSPPEVTTSQTESVPDLGPETLPEVDFSKNSYNVIINHGDGTQNSYYLYTDKEFLGEALEDEDLIKRTGNRIVMLDGKVVNPNSNWLLETATPIADDSNGESTSYSKSVCSKVGIDQTPVVKSGLYIITETQNEYKGPSLTELDIQSKVLLIRQQNFDYSSHYDTYYVLESDGSCYVFIPITGEWSFSAKGNYTIKNNVISFKLTTDDGSTLKYEYQYNAAFGTFMQITNKGLCNVDELGNTFTIAESNKYTLDSLKNLVNAGMS